MRKIVITLIFAACGIMAAFAVLAPSDYPASPLVELRERVKRRPPKSVDHSNFAVLKQRFLRPQDVTTACISCHNRRHIEVMESNHWNWEREEYVRGKGIVYIGKRNAVNNFCISSIGNEQSCGKCHIGVGSTATGLNVTDPSNIDCLVCHDNTDTYLKKQEGGGAPDPSVDIGHIARNVGRPTRSSCGVCHFFGGGGNNVKHGDLEQAMFSPDRSVDVHMAVDGLNLDCVDCHRTERHLISGKLYSLSSMNRHRVTCEQCHGEMPHENDIINEHTNKVACQTCHIPTYAKVAATKTFWDWSTAGKLRNGEPYEIDDKDGNHTYLSIKGTFTWARNLTPEYAWFNGTASHYLLGDTYDETAATIVLNPLHGSYRDEDAKIIPVKVHRATQPADPGHRTIIIPKLYADTTGEGAFWRDFNWKRSAEVGMKRVGLPFSGRVVFVTTAMNWPINHMVASKDSSLACTACHTRTNSRLAGLTDFYLPGRDRSGVVDTLGMALLLLTLAGALAHGALRIAMRKRNTTGGVR